MSRQRTVLNRNHCRRFAMRAGRLLNLSEEFDMSVAGTGGDHASSVNRYTLNRGSQSVAFRYLTALSFHVPHIDPAILSTGNQQSLLLRRKLHLGDRPAVLF